MDDFAMKVINMEFVRQWLRQWIKIAHRHVRGLELELPSATD
jgi:hypothetical protein